MENNINVESMNIMSLNQMCDIALGFVHPGVIHFDILHELLRTLIQQCNLMDVRVRIPEKRSLERNLMKLPSFEVIDVDSHVSYHKTHSTENVTPIRKSEVELIPSSKSKERQTFEAAWSPPTKISSKKDLPGHIEEHRHQEHTASIPHSVQDHKVSMHGVLEHKSSMPHGVQEHKASMPHSIQEHKSSTPYVAQEHKMSTPYGVQEHKASMPHGVQHKTSKPHAVQEHAVSTPSGIHEEYERTVSILEEKMQWMIDSIESLQNQINEMKQLPSNKDILESLRGSVSRTPSFDKSTQKIDTSTTPSRNLSNTPIVDMLQILTLTKRIDAAEESVTKLASLVEDIAREFAMESKEPVLDIESLTELRGTPIGSLGNKQALELLSKEVTALKALLRGDGQDLGAQGANLQTKMAAADVKMKQMMDQIENIDRTTSVQITGLSVQCGELEDTMSRLETKLVDTLVGQKAPLMALNERYHKLEDQMEQMEIEHKRVLDSIAQREMEISALIEQLEVLKTSKVSKEEFEGALDKKLDAERIVTKVSQEKFDKVYNDMKSNIEETIQKLSTQEEMWQKALLELQGEVVTKLEKTEMVALEGFVREKLKILRDKLRSMKNFQAEKEAAATKQMLMRNLKCLSCDADVTAKVKQLPQDYPRTPMLPSNKSIAPYLTYELDVLRKQQRGLTDSRNLHHFEASLRNKGQRVENRYCGGPHTVTTPVQRVTRLGHFLEQWGPEITTANENFVKGTDQKVYVGCISGSELNKQQSMVIEGNILREKKSHHEDMANIPEKDAVDLKQELNKKSGTVATTVDVGKASPGTTARKNRKSVGNPEEQIRKKISAFSFDDNPEDFPDL